MPKVSTNKLLSAFFSVFSVLKQQMRLNQPVYGLSIAQLEALSYIGRRERLTMKELADFLSVTPPSATVLVNHLVRLNFLNRSFSRSDRRTVYLSLTASGKKKLQRANAQKNQVLAGMLKALNLRQRLQLLQILEKMTI